jgi:uncharacterized metal-binding protein
MNDDRTRVVIVPCSGIGKSFGTISREAAYEVTEELCPADTQLVALSRLVLGDEDARAIVAANPAVTLDGCKHACATKMVAESGGTVAHSLAVLDVCRRHRDLKPSGIAQLNEAGQKLALLMAQEVAADVAALVSRPAGALVSGPAPAGAEGDSHG